MDEEKNELPDSPQPEPANEAQSQEAGPDLEQKNKDLYARLKKTEEELKKFKAAASSESPKTSDFDIEEIVNLRTDGYSREEVEYMKQVARGAKRPLSEITNDPFVQAGILGLREKSKTNDVTPAPSSRPNPVVVGQKPWSEMTEQERKAGFTAQVNRFKRKVQRVNE